MVLTFDEAANISRTLQSLSWAVEVLVIDSFSTDETLKIAQQFPGVRVLQRAFDTFADQCNFGLSHIRTEWVLSLDADYVVTPEFVSEINELEASPSVDGFSTPFLYCVGGRRLRSCLYPPRTVLYRRKKGRYFNDGHGHKVAVNGSVGHLTRPILHDDRKSLNRWLKSQDRYALLELKKLASARRETLKLQDRIRLCVLPAPFVVFFYTLFAKRLILDGWPGWLYAFQRMTAELILSMHLLEWRLSRDGKGNDGSVRNAPQD